MRQEDINKLNEPYTQLRDRFDRRFHSAVGADVPNANKIVGEIFDDLSRETFGVSWWQSVPTHERILISDYLYQCAEGIETNLVEAKLHFLEWHHIKDQQDERIADVISRTPYGVLQQKLPPSIAPIDDLPNKLEAMHICGFFRAIGSALDCLGGAIIGVIGLDYCLRYNDIARARKELGNIKNPQTPGEQLQAVFKDFLETQIKNSGPEDWLVWADQYRNMYVHRGRRITFNEFVTREVLLYDANEQLIPRWRSKLHLATHPDKSDAEAFIKSDILLNEDAEKTLTGVFRSTRDLLEAVCERLVSIWQERRNNPSLILQPASQWKPNMKPCNFAGYNQAAESINASGLTGNPVLLHRMIASATVDQYRYSVWANSPWAQ
jgi:hypothetical protein